jgi:hypothetical protein
MRRAQNDNAPVSGAFPANFREIDLCDHAAAPSSGGNRPGPTMTARCVIAALLCLPAIGFADSLRCGQALVKSGDAVADLAKKCGEPAEKRMVEKDVWAPNVGNRGTRKVGVDVTEFWVYERGRQSFRMVVEVADMRVRSIRRE